MVSFNIWVVLEWLGTLLALSGSFILASRKLKPTVSWGLWLGSNICYIMYFYKTQQNGLLLMNLIGFFINIFGLYQWLQNDEKINKGLTNFLFNLSLVCFAGSVLFALLFIFSPSIKNAEWIGSSLGITAAFLISSRHKYSFLCWFIWTISNSILLIMSIITKQYGFMFLQSGFMIINVYGAMNWIKEAQQLKADIAKAKLGVTEVMETSSKT